MERKIMEVLQRMQQILQEEQLQELQAILRMVFTGCEIVEETGLQIIDGSWQQELEEYLISKALEGKSPATVDRYRYELQRLLAYVNKSVMKICPGV